MKIVIGRTGRMNQGRDMNVGTAAGTQKQMARGRLVAPEKQGVVDWWVQGPRCKVLSRLSFLSVSSNRSNYNILSVKTITTSVVEPIKLQP